MGQFSAGPINIAVPEFYKYSLSEGRQDTFRALFSTQKEFALTVFD